MTIPHKAFGGNCVSLNGFSIDPDDFYLSWPRKSWPDQVELCGWLQNLTPQEELSVFLASRGGVLSHVNGDFANALIAFAYSARLRPGSAQSTARLNAASEGLYGKIIAAHPEAYRQMAARIADQATAKPVAMPPGGGTSAPAPWWRSEAGRTANMAEVQRMNEENRRNMERMQSAVPPQPNGVPTPGIPPKQNLPAQPMK